MRLKLITSALIVFTVFLVPNALYAQKSTDTARTKIGNPPESTGLWPTVGRVTQGPKGPTSHARIQSVGGGPAVDIANTPGTAIFATFDGAIRTYDCTNRGECDNTYGSLGNYVKITPDSNPSAIVLYGHMMSITATDGRISAGDKIGLMGDTGAAPGAFHLHYEFRGIPMTPPNVPDDITPQECEASCSPSSVSTSNSQAKDLNAITPLLGLLKYDQL